MTHDSYEHYPQNRPVPHPGTSMDETVGGAVDHSDTPMTDTPPRPQPDTLTETDSNRILDMAIASTLGYRIVKQRTGYTVVKSPDGTVSRDYIGEKEAQRGIPYFETDLNAAWQLTEPFFFKLVPLYTGAGKAGVIATLSDGDGNEGKGRAETPSGAICLAWIDLHASLNAARPPTAD